MAAGIAAVYLAALAIVVFRRDSGAQNLVGYSTMALTIIVAAILSQRGLRSGVSLLSRTRPGPRWAWCIAGGLMLLSLSSDAWVHVFHPASGDVSANAVAAQVREHTRGSPSPFMTGLWIALAGPVAEELVFRGLIFNVLAQARKWVAARYSTALVLSAAVISSLLLALWHGDAADTLPDRFAIGMILCGVYWWTASLLPVIAVHAAWNFRWFQVAALGSHPSLLGMWPNVDLLVLTGVLTAVAASAASRRNLAKRWSAFRVTRRSAGRKVYDKTAAAEERGEGAGGCGCARDRRPLRSRW